jgi:hypothetical protein
MPLQPQQRIEEDEAADMEQQHCDGVGQPILLAGLLDAAEPVEPNLDGSQNR